MLYDPNKTKKMDLCHQHATYLNILSLLNTLRRSWLAISRTLRVPAKRLTSRTLIKQPKENMKKKTLAYMHKLKTTQKQKKKK